MTEALPSTASSTTEQRLDRTWLVGVSLLALAVRLPQIGASFYGDERFSVLRDSEHLLTPTEDRFRPIFFSLLYLWKQLGFQGEAGLRTLPLLFGILQIPVAYQLGRLLAGRPGARGLCVLIALNPMLIEFSQELRMYSLVPLLALLQAVALATLEARAAAGTRQLHAWIGFVAAGTLGVYTHFHYWFLNTAFALALLRRRRTLPLRSSCLAVAAIGLLYLPNVPNLLRFHAETAGHAHLLATDVVGAVPKLLAAFLLGFNYFPLPQMGIERSIGASTLTDNLALVVPLLVPALCLGGVLVRRHLKGPLGPVLWMGHELFTVPVLFSLLALVAARLNFIHPKYMVFCSPFLQLFVLAGWLELRVPWQRRLTLASYAAVVVIALWHFNQPVAYGRREDERGMAEVLRRRIDERSVVLLLGGPDASETMARRERPQFLFEYYGPDLLPYVRVVAMPKTAVQPEYVAAKLERLTAGKQEIHFVWSEIFRNFHDPRDLVLQALRRAHPNEQRTQLSPRLVLYSYRTEH